MEPVLFQKCNITDTKLTYIVISWKNLKLFFTLKRKLRSICNIREVKNFGSLALLRKASSCSETTQAE